MMHRVIAVALLVFLVATLTAVPSSARKSAEDDPKGFVESIAETVYAWAWPSAEYESASVKSIDPVAGGYDVLVKLSGKSAFDGGDLWLVLVFKLRNGSLADVKVSAHNAILVPPFATVKALGQLIAELAAEQSYRSPPKASSPQPLYQPRPRSEPSFGWRICNKSTEPEVWVAYSYLDGGDWVTKGWRKIERGRCSVMLRQVKNRYMYYYAEGPKKVWSGGMKLCTHPKEKFANRKKTCPAGFKLYRYVEVDAGASPRWTTNLVD
ncbi:MAG: DUF1036 domain-containing protein [Acidobacteria bacterium]|nr:MAG: DUF1036 domain-containing protein [Acidobacteriota bacterium]